MQSDEALHVDVPVVEERHAHPDLLPAVRMTRHLHLQVELARRLVARRARHEAEPVLTAHRDGAHHPRHGLLRHARAQVDAPVRPVSGEYEELCGREEKGGGLKSTKKRTGREYGMAYAADRA